MESIIPCRNAHAGLRQGQGPGPIASYYVTPVPCSSPVPVPHAM